MVYMLNSVTDLKYKNIEAENLEPTAQPAVSSAGWRVGLEAVHLCFLQMACLSESPLSGVFTGHTLLRDGGASDSGQFQGLPEATFSYLLLSVFFFFPR